MANLPINSTVDGGGARPLDFGTVNYVHSPFGGKLPIEVKPTNEVVNTPKEVAYSSVNLSPEEKFYESLGLKDKGGLTLPLKSKGRLLVAVVLVAGYFAYKKFKK
jgi:hypothetical protein